MHGIEKYTPRLLFFLYPPDNFIHPIDMLVLFETPAGFALFKCLDDGKLSAVDDIGKHFESASSANKLLQLKAFSKFESTAKALEVASELVEGHMTDHLKKFLKTELGGKSAVQEKLAVADPKLGKEISKKFSIPVISDQVVMELMRGIRSQLANLIEDLPSQEMNVMALGLAHSLSRHKIKFSPDKVDTMIIQAIALLDDLDKELNIYSMRLKEWYGWHFPELTKVLVDNLAYAKTIRLMGLRTNAPTIDFSDILPEDLEKQLKELSQVSMGTEISDEDLDHIQMLADQIIGLYQYRTELFEYLKNRMVAIAPNLTNLVGELVGARLISHAGSLVNLAKHPASTVQILGAEKALFRALKTKQNTPKYGLIFHASLVGQATPKLKGKIARVLAAKSALAVRVDALSDAQDAEAISGDLGTNDRLKVEQRLRQLERQVNMKQLGTPRGRTDVNKKFEFVSSRQYNPETDVVKSATKDTSVKKEETKRKFEEPIVKQEEDDKKEREDKKKSKDEDKKKQKDEDKRKKTKKQRYHEETQ